MENSPIYKIVSRKLIMMNNREAQDMLKSASFKRSPQVWLDFGCGSGIFTKALAEILPAGSRVIGIDRDPQKLPGKSSNGNEIKFLHADFSENLTVDKVDGILMANSLHYIEDKNNFIDRTLDLINYPRQMLLVEYDTDQPNQWVPFPIPFHELKQLFSEEDFQIRKLGERSSIYGSQIMYAVQILEDNRKEA